MTNVSFQSQATRHPTIGLCGQVADIQRGLRVSRACAEVGGLEFGLGVAEAASDGACKLPSAADDTIVGVAVFRHVPPDAAGFVGYQNGEAVSVLAQGAIYIEPETDVAKGDPVYVRHTGAGRGRFRNDDAGGEAALLKEARFTMSGTADTLVRLALNLPG